MTNQPNDQTNDTNTDEIDINPYTNRQARIDDTQTAKRLAKLHEKMTPLDGGPSEDDLDEEPADAEDNNDEDTSQDDEKQDDNINKKYTIRVNGKEIEMSFDELVAKAQKVESADEYLRLAKNATQDLSEQDDQESSVVDSSTKRNDLADEDIVQAIQMGDEEEAKVALQKFRAGIIKDIPSVNTDELIREMNEKNQYTSALESFQEEFSDLINDEYLLAAVLAEERKQLASHDNRSFQVRFTEIGNKVRDWAGSKTSSSSSGSNTPTNDEKLERKRNAKSAPTSNATRSNMNAEVDDSYEQKIENMRNSRPAHLARQGLLKGE